MITLVLLVITAVIILHHFFIHHGKQGKFINLIPGPRPLPIMGNLYNLQVSADVLWEKIREMSDKYYPIYRIWSVTIPCVNIRHPDDVEVILGSPRYIKKSLLYTLLQPWFSTGLLTSSGQKWQTRRKILTPAFHFNVLQQFVDVFIEESESMCETLKKEGGSVIKDLLPFMSQHTLNAICETAMGTSLRGRGEFQHKYRKAVYDMGLLLVRRLIRPWLHTDFVFGLTFDGMKQARVLKILHGFTKKIIMERTEYHDQTDGRYLKSFGNDDANDETQGETEFGVRKRRLAMLDLLIAAHRNNQIDFEGIREEVDTFMFEGHDTTATAICYAIMLLAEHKEIQDRARAEIDAAIEENGGKLSMSVLQRLPYLERCIKEALRMYPSVHFISRELQEDVQLTNYYIPAGTLIHIHIIDIHKDPNFWPNPEIYDPDRFLPERIQGRHPYSYVPFSAGPRNCIGQKFAMLEMKAMIGLLLHNFYFEPIDYLKDLRITADLVLRPTHPIRTKFVPIII